MLKVGNVEDNEADNEKDNVEDKVSRLNGVKHRHLRLKPGVILYIGFNQQLNPTGATHR